MAKTKPGPTPGEIAKLFNELRAAGRRVLTTALADFNAAVDALENFYQSHKTASWVGSLAICLSLAISALLGNESALLASGECTGKLILEFLLFEGSAAAVAAINALRAILGIGRTTKMACVNFHKSSTRVQGPGLCCAQVGIAGGLVAPPPGTILPAYQPGQADAGAIPAGRITQVTTAAGKCASCMIVGSTSKKHPGKPVLKFVMGGPLCPTAGTGCCSL